MLFNSIEFAIFLPVVFIIYWLLLNRNLRIQNTFLLLVSYLFYGWWDWRFLSLIIISSITDFSVAYYLNKVENQGRRRILLITSILVNIGFLGYFKYYNFFVENLILSFTFFGSPLNLQTLNIILPVGISFYTFQTLSYTIDVFKRKIEPTTDLITFFAYVSFFPQLVAGPIERATNLLPQFARKREFSYHESVDGMRQILWGLFKKVVIADNCAPVVNEVFGNPDLYPGYVLLIGAVFFAFQIYGDFSGYSDIAIGTANLFGFRLMRNFAFPYFARDIAEFWRCWHISLSTWFRDYIYIPLGGSQITRLGQVRNIFIIFLVSGFWHGANWTFIVWGGLNAVYFMPLMLLNKNRSNMGRVGGDKMLPSPKEFFQIITTFTLTVLAWIFFRAESVTAAWDYLLKIIFSFTQEFGGSLPSTRRIWVFIIIMLTVEWLQRDKQHGMQIDRVVNPYLRYSMYFFVAILIWAHGSFDKTEFIYFAF